MLTNRNESLFSAKEKVFTCNAVMNPEGGKSFYGMAL
jgi:hypothetical protein